MSRSLSQARLKELLSYDPETGQFIWLQSRGRVSIGSVAGTLRSDGYVQIKVDGELFLAHHLAFLYMGEPIPSLVDHDDCNGSNNRWRNIRPANNSENGGNSRLSKANTSGYKGVRWDPSRNKWKATIKHNYRAKLIGRFDTLDEAKAAYAIAAKQAFGKFARIV